MPGRHGIAHEGDYVIGRFGVWSSFEILSQHPFRRSLGNIHQPTNLAFHFRQALRLFFYFLHMFQQKYRAFVQFIEQGGLAGPNPKGFWDIQDEANGAAQGTLTNLNIILDDIARIIPFVLFEVPTPEQIPDTFSDIQRLLRDYSDSDTVKKLRALFADLNSEDSWWRIGSKYEIGLRNRFIHYPDFIVLGYSTPSGETSPRPHFELCRIGTPGSTVDFPAQLRTMLHGLCEWLDQVDATLLGHLVARARESLFDWHLPKECPGYALPIVGPVLKTTNLPDDYLFLPVCTD